MGSQLDDAKQQRACIVSGIDQENQNVSREMKQKKLRQNSEATDDVGTHPEDRIDMAKLLCDLDFIKAEYERAAVGVEHDVECFRISIDIAGAVPCTIRVAISDGAQFAAELDVLAALMRARALKVQLSGQALAG